MFLPLHSCRRLRRIGSPRAGEVQLVAQHTLKPGTYGWKCKRKSIDVIMCKRSQLICTDASSCIQECLAGLVRSSVLQGLEPSLKKVRLPQNMRLLQELVRCKNSCQLYKSMIQIQKPSRAEGRKPADSPKMMPCSIKVRRD